MYIFIVIIFSIGTVYTLLYLLTRMYMLSSVYPLHSVPCGWTICFYDVSLALMSVFIIFFGQRKVEGRSCACGNPDQDKLATCSNCGAQEHMYYRLYSSQLLVYASHLEFLLFSVSTLPRTLSRRKYQVSVSIVVKLQLKIRFSG